MPIEHLPADSPSEKACEIVERDGALVIDRLLDRASQRLDAPANGLGGKRGTVDTRSRIPIQIQQPARPER